MLVKVTYPSFVRTTCQSLISSRLQCLVELTNSAFVYIDRMRVSASIALLTPNNNLTALNGVVLNAVPSYIVVMTTLLNLQALLIYYCLVRRQITATVSLPLDKLLRRTGKAKLR